MLEKLLQPRMIKPGEEVADISVEHPVHLPFGYPNRERVQRIMRTALGPKPVRKTEKVLLVYRTQHLHHRALENLVLQHRDPERTLPPVRLRYVHAARGARPVGTAMHAAEQVFEIDLEILPVDVPRHLINTRCGLRVDPRISRRQASQVDVMQQCGEPCLLIPSRCLAHTIQPVWHALPGTVSGTCRPVRVPLDWAPSLHHLRDRSRGVVRQLRRYYAPI